MKKEVLGNGKTDHIAFIEYVPISTEYQNATSFICRESLELSSDISPGKSFKTNSSVSYTL